MWFNFGPSVSSLDRRPGRRARSSIPRRSTARRLQRPGDGRRQLRRPRTRTSRSASIVEWDVTDALGLAFDYHSFDRRVGRGQPVRLERSPRHGRLHSRHHHGGFQPGLPGAERCAAARLNGASIRRRCWSTGSSFRNSYMKSEVDQVQMQRRLRVRRRLAPGFRRQHSPRSTTARPSPTCSATPGAASVRRQTTPTTSGPTRQHPALFRQISPAAATRLCSTSSSSGTSRRSVAAAAAAYGDPAKFWRRRTSRRTVGRGRVQERVRAVQPYFDIGHPGARGRRRALRVRPT